MTDSADPPPRPGFLRIVWGLFLILIGYRDLLAEYHERCYAEVIAAYAQALKIRMSATPLPGGGEAAMAARIDAALAEGGDTKACFARLLAIETEHFYRQDGVGRMATAQGIRERHHRVAAPAAIAAREAEGYPALSVQWTDEMTADTVGMLNYIHARYIMNIAREEAVARQKSVLLLRFRRIAAGFVGVVLVSALVWLIANLFGHGAPVYEFVRGFIGIALIFTLGYLGAVVSVSQRFQKAVEADVLQADPVFLIGGIAMGQRGIDVAMVMAGVFAVLLHCVFAGGMASTLGLAGGIFPTVSGCAAAGETSPIGNMARALGYCGQNDLLRMFVFAFAAGYAERLVPDVLNRIARDTTPG